jgi:hypothetical protein
MAKQLEVIIPFKGFKKGDVKNFSDEMAKKYASNLKEPAPKKVKTSKKEEE